MATNQPFQFSLRSALAVMTACCLLMGGAVLLASALGIDRSQFLAQIALPLGAIFLIGVGFGGVAWLTVGGGIDRLIHPLTLYAIVGGLSAVVGVVAWELGRICWNLL